MIKTAAIIGATGLIGGHLLRILERDPLFNSIHVILRRPANLNTFKVKEEVIDFSDFKSLKEALEGSDAVFCAVGTTQKKVKRDKAAYRSVDFDIPVNAAKICAELQISHFLLVSSIGADSKSSNFYLRLKGEVEDEIRKLHISCVSIFQPSLLLGKRNEYRFGEGIAQKMMSLFSFFIPSAFKPIKAEEVARAMVKASKRRETGFNIYQYKEMMKFED